MKKWFFGFVILLVIALAGWYFLKPAPPAKVEQMVSIITNPQAFQRTILHDDSWAKWWPHEGNTRTAPLNPLRFSYNDRTYTLVEKRQNTILIDVLGGKDTVHTALTFIPSFPDTMHVIWAASENPVRSYQPAAITALNKDLRILLEKMDNYYSRPEHVYDRKIEQILVTDSLLVSTVKTTKGYPSIPFIYDMIGTLRNYVKSQSAKETGFPMLNITTNDSLEFLTRVALPVDRRLPGTDAISYKWMMGGGKILVTEVKGGPQAIKEAVHQLDNFVRDHNRVAPAIPFQSLITDRMAEKDTSRWITKLFYPVM
ncbi:MAG TPA: hypothetical protein VHK91_06315 [Flavisolibacter sp.]|jgi:hypothetical protein|nr:hypothetical protein [Flavisolibacter sp.]